MRKAGLSGASGSAGSAVRPDNLHALTRLLRLNRDYHEDRKEIEKAVAAMNRLIEANRAHGYRYGEAQARHDRGLLRQDPETAIEDVREALKIREEIDDLEGTGWSLNNLGYALPRLKRHEEAERHLRRAIAVFNQIEHRGGHLKALANLADVHRATGNAEERLKAETEWDRLNRSGGQGEPGTTVLRGPTAGEFWDHKAGKVVLVAAWTKNEFEFTGPMATGGLKTAARDQPADLDINGVMFRFARHRLWFEGRMIFLADGESAEITRGGYVRLRRR